MGHGRVNLHPVRLWTWANKLSGREGVSLLNELRFVSDNCIEPEDVAIVDAERAFLALGAIAYIHPDRRPPVEEWPENIRPHIEIIDFDIKF